MGYYKTMEPEDKALEEFPGLSREDLEEVEWRFNKYLLYQGDRHGRQIWTTCCHEDFYMEGEKGQLTGTHGDRLHCPFCGETVQVVCRGRIRSGATLRQYIPFLFLHASEDGQTVWAQGYWTTRDLVNKMGVIRRDLEARGEGDTAGKLGKAMEALAEAILAKAK